MVLRRGYVSGGGGGGGGEREVWGGLVVRERLNKNYDHLNIQPHVNGIISLECWISPMEFHHSTVEPHLNGITPFECWTSFKPNYNISMLNLIRMELRHLNFEPHPNGLMTTWMMDFIQMIRIDSDFTAIDTSGHQLTRAVDIIWRYHSVRQV